MKTITQKEINDLYKAAKANPNSTNICDIRKTINTGTLNKSLSLGVAKSHMTEKSSKVK